MIKFDADNNISSIWNAKIEDTDSTGALNGVVFQTEYSGILTGNLGKSYTYQQQVTDVMKPRFKISIFFGLIGLTLSYLVCVPLGIKKALNHGSTFDFLSSVMIFVAYSIPGWAFGGRLPSQSMVAHGIRAAARPHDVPGVRCGTAIPP